MTKTLGALIAKWYAADVALGRSIAEDNGEPVEDAISIEEALGKPCSAADVKALEKHLGSALPASYRAVKRYDDALAMCKVAVETGYSQLDKLRTDRDLGPLLKRRELEALFTAR